MNRTVTHSVPARWRGGSTSGFTLPEMLVGLAIGTMALAGILSTYVLSIKGFSAISNYVEIHRGGRKSVDTIAHDMRAVSGITSYSSSNITVVIPTAFDTTGTAISNKTVNYTFTRGKLIRTDSGTGFTDALATNIYQLTFTLFDRLGNTTTQTNTAKGVQVDIKLRKYVINQIQSEDFLSARWDMRNIP